MSLQTRLAALISAIGTDIKTLQTRVPPAGGTIGQILGKKTNTDYDTQWIAQLVGLNWQGGWSSGSTYQMDNVVSFQSGLYRANINTAAGQSPLTHPEYWSTMVSPELPIGGTTSQILSKRTATNYDVQWSNPTGGAGLPEIYIGDAQPTRNAEVLWVDTDEAAPATLNVTMDTWHTVGAAGEPVFGTGASNYGAGEEALGFRKLPDGTVRLKGTINAPSLNGTIFTLPVGYRPPAIIRVSIVSAGVAGSAYITSAGVVAISQGGLSGVDLTGVEFDTQSVLQTASVAAQPMDKLHFVGGAGEPTFNSPWVNFDNSLSTPGGGTSRDAGFRKYPDGRVRLYGTIKGGTNGSTIFTLPAGYRPSRTSSVVFAVSANGGPAQITVNLDGTVTATNIVGTTSVTTWVWLDGVEFDTETVSAYTSGVIGPQRVTVLPVGAVDGQEVYFVADATNGVLWHLRYNAASASAYKWEFVGGADLDSQIATTQNITADGVYHDVATLGPDVTVPLAGDYSYEFSVIGTTGSGTGYVYSGLVLGAGATPVVPHEMLVFVTAAGGYGSICWGQKMTGLTAGQLLRLRYAITGGGTGTVRSRRLAIRPARVG